MNNAHVLDELDMPPATLTREWVVTIDTPTAGVDGVLKALEENLSITQGPYDCCSYVRDSGYQRFRALEGSHAGAEGTVQETRASQIVISIPTDAALLSKAFEVIFKAHVNEEPTIRVAEVWASRSKLLDDNVPLKFSEVLALQHRLIEAGFDVVKTENLYTFGGEPGYAAVHG